MSADEKFHADVEQTKADFSQIRAKIVAETGEAKAKAQAELGAIEKDIDTEEATNQAAMAEYFEKRDAGEIGLN